MRKLIKVTKEDIQLGEMYVEIGSRRRSECCPVATSLHRQGYEKAQVGYTGIYLDHFMDPYDRRSLPRSVRRFLRAFDKDGSKAVKPFSFYLDIKDENE